MIKRAARKAKWAWNLVRFTARAAPLVSAAFCPALAKAARICRRGRFTPAEAFRLGLFHPAGKRVGLFPVFSRKRLTKLQKALNPESASLMLQNKSIFYRYCAALGVEIPPTCAMFFPGTAGIAPDGSVLASRQDWERFLSGKLPDEFVAKPTFGALGRGVRIFTRRDGAFGDAMGGTLNVAELYDQLVAGAGDAGMILQERLMNHPDLVRLTGTEYLQTLRVVTLLDDRESCRVLYSHFKVITDHRVLDNSYHDEPSAGVRAEVDVHTGRLTRAVRTPGTCPGFSEVPAHPKTGLPFGGFQLPFWPEVCKLARTVAVAFWPLRAIGWDIALVPMGPRIVEGNVWWDPPQGQLTLPSLVAELARAAGQAEPASCDPDSPLFP